MIDALPVKDAPASQGDASFTDIAARRRGRLRRYLFLHPRVLDALVGLCYLLLVTPTAVESATDGAWPVVALLAVAAAALFFRRGQPVPVVAAVAALELAVILLHPWGSNVSAGLWSGTRVQAVVYAYEAGLVVPSSTEY